MASDCACRPFRDRHLEGRHPAGRRPPSPSTPPRASTSRRTSATTARHGAWTGTARHADHQNRECVRCMHCINVMPKALRPGTERGATILIGAKAPISRARCCPPFSFRLSRRELMETIKELVSADLGFLGRIRKEPRAGRRIDPARGHGQPSSTPSALNPCRNGQRSARQSLHFLPGQGGQVAERLGSPRPRVNCPVTFEESRRGTMATPAKRITDIGPPHYEKVPPPGDQEELREVEVSRNTGAGSPLPRRRRASGSTPSAPDHPGC